jgi:hypothetical protein
MAVANRLRLTETSLRFRECSTPRPPWRRTSWVKFAKRAAKESAASFVSAGSIFWPDRTVTGQDGVNPNARHK